MYVPASFAVTDLAQLHAWIEAFNFATLVSPGRLESGSARDGAAEMEATHLPLLLDRMAGVNGTLVGHFARANRQWQSAGQTVLAIFQGPHAYISPRWYERPDLVPTWNYVSVHAYGRLEVIDDPTFAVELVRRMTEHYEGAFDRPWQMTLDEAALRQLAAQIVAFRLPIERIEGKAKLSQNHPEDRRRRVVTGLRQQCDGSGQQIAEMMELQLNLRSQVRDEAG